MMIETQIFQRTVLDFARLIPYGFTQNGDSYYFSKTLLNGDFLIEVVINQHGEIYGKVIDTMDGSDYDNVHIAAQKGAFVNSVREEYRSVLKDIADNCCQQMPFASEQGNRLAEMIALTWQEAPDRPFKKYPETGVFRNPGNDKWYALVTTVSKIKLEPALDKANGEACLEIINVKVDKTVVSDLQQIDGIYPAYHMNKRHWVTVALDERLTDERLFALVTDSRDFTFGQYTPTDVPKSWLVPANPKYFDLIKAFEMQEIIHWKQGASIAVGDIVYLYYGAPYSAILYRCKVLEVDIPYDNPKPSARINKLMRIQRLSVYDQSKFPLATLKTYGVKTIRNARRMPEALIQQIMVTEKAKVTC